MQNIARVGIDLAKRVFHVTAVDGGAALGTSRQGRSVSELESPMEWVARMARSMSVTTDRRPEAAEGVFLGMSPDTGVR